MRRRFTHSRYEVWLELKKLSRSWDDSRRYYGVCQPLVSPVSPLWSLSSSSGPCWPYYGVCQPLIVPTNPLSLPAPSIRPFLGFLRRHRPLHPRQTLPPSRRQQLQYGNLAEESLGPYKIMAECSYVVRRRVCIKLFWYFYWEKEI